MEADHVTGMEMLSVIVNVLLAVLLIFLIYFIITLTSSVKRVSKQLENLLYNTNSLVDDTNSKTRKLDGIFNTIDHVSDRVNETLYSIEDYLVKFFTNLISKFRKNNNEEGEIYE